MTVQHDSAARPRPARAVHPPTGPEPTTPTPTPTPAPTPALLRSLAAADAGSRARALESAQASSGNRAVQRLLGGAASDLVDLATLTAEAARLLVTGLVGGAGAVTNELTDALFWFAHPDLRGARLEPGTPEAQQWLTIRDSVVRPLLHPKPGTPAADAHTAAAPTGLTPTDHVAAQSGPATTAGTGDRYFTQDAGHYQDTSGGTVRVWMYGSSAANVCNMTSLTMSLVSIAGESELRSRLIGLLHTAGMHEGAQVQVGGRWTPLATALDDPKLVARIETLDLVTAAAIGTSGGYGSVTKAATIARIANATGLATASETTGAIHLTDAKVRAKAAALLAAGNRVIAGTVNHYIYLLEVRDDGVLVHDPAGARVQPDLTGKLFLHNGSAAHLAGEFLGFDATRRERAVRRLSQNPSLAPLVDRLQSIAAMSGADRAAGLKALRKDFPGDHEAGERNYYAAGEFAENDLRLRVTVTPT